MSTATYAMGTEVTIVQAAALRDGLLARLATAPQTLLLDMGEVQEFDSAGVQLLLATQRALTEAGAELAFTAASPAVRRGLELFGLAALLNGGAGAQAEASEEPSAARSAGASA